MQYLLGFEVAGHHKSLGDRAQAETFVLNGIDLLPRLPVYIVGEVAMLYEEYSQIEIAAITYEKGRYRNQVTCFHINPAQEDSDEEQDSKMGHTAMQRGDQVLFVQAGQKQMLHKVLSNAPVHVSKNVTG